MSAREFEAFLARIYVDAEVRARFKANPREEAEQAGLSAKECAALEKTDWVGLELAARSFASKRAFKRQERSENSFNKTLRNLFAALSARIRRRLSER